MLGRFLFSLLFLLILTEFRVQARAPTLHFRGCTSSPNRLLLCIDECEKDEPPSDPHDLYLPRVVVLDLIRQTLEEPKATDEAIVCPNLDNEVFKQSAHVVDASCLLDGRLQFRLGERQGLNDSNTAITFLAEITLPKEREQAHSLEYSALFFTLPKQQLYVVVEERALGGTVGLLLEGGAPEWPQRSQWKMQSRLQISSDLLAGTLSAYSNGTCSSRVSQAPPVQPVPFPSIGLVAFPGSPFVWYSYNASGLYEFAANGVVDSRRGQIIEVSELTVRLHPYDGVRLPLPLAIELKDQVRRFQVKPPNAFAPSVILFTLSLTLVIGLVAAEKITRKRKQQEKARQEQLNPTERPYSPVDASNSDREVEMTPLPTRKDSTAGSEDEEMLLHPRRAVDRAGSRLPLDEI